MSSDNPYQSPKTTGSSAPPSIKVAPYIFGILLLVGMVPASGVAFFCCCLAGVAASEGPGKPAADPFTIGMTVGSIGGLLVFVLMLVGGIWLIRRSKTKL